MKVVNYRFPDGYYTGKLKKGKRHDDGRMVFDNGDIYEGCWTDDKMDIDGIYYYANGDKFDGFWYDGVIHGRGKYTFKNGDILIGEWVMGKKDGFFTLILNNGETKSLTFKDDIQVDVYRKHQYQTYSKKEEYDGEVDEFGRKDGFGVYVDGKYRYEGEWRQGERHGNGKCWFYNGDRYEGTFQNNDITGKGTYYYANGNKYIGQLKCGIPNGQGVMIEKDGTRIEATWIDGKKEGECLYTTPSNKQIIGNCVNDMKDGIWLSVENDNVVQELWRDGEMKQFPHEEKIQFKDGYYQGWVNEDGEMSSTGKLFFNNGDVYKGTLSNPQRTSWDMKHFINESGIMNYANGDRYEGEWSYGSKSGKGIYFYANGERYEGNWEYDKKDGVGKHIDLYGCETIQEWSNGINLLELNEFLNNFETQTETEDYHTKRNETENYDLDLLCDDLLGLHYNQFNSSNNSLKDDERFSGYDGFGDNIIEPPRNNRNTISKRGKRKKHKKSLFSSSESKKSYSLDSDTSDYDFSSTRDLNDYSSYNGNGTYISNAEFDDGRISSIDGLDVEYEDGRISSIGGLDVEYEDGHMTSIGGEDVNFDSDGKITGWGDNNLEFGDNNPWL